MPEVRHDNHWGIFDSGGNRLQVVGEELTPAFLRRVVCELDEEFGSEFFINISIPPELEFSLRRAIEGLKLGNIGTGAEPTTKPSWFTPFCKTPVGISTDTVDSVRLTKLNVITHDFLPPNVFFLSNGIKMVVCSTPVIKNAAHV